MDQLGRISLRRIVHEIRSSFWFIPALLSLVAIVVAIFFVDTELQIRRSVNSGLTPAMSLESARLVLSTIAGSMITVASLVFSMTLVALTLVSQQLGPRVLLRFMDDRPTQIVLGLFLATFLFALLVLTRMEQAAGDVPSLAVVAAVGLAVVSMGAIIHFIHHIATRIQADVLIGELSEGLDRAVGQRTKRGVNGGQDVEIVEQADADRLDQMFKSQDAVPVAIKASGYLNLIDESAMIKCAVKNDLVMRVELTPGDFVLAGIPVMTVVCSDGEFGDDARDAVRRLIQVNSRRTAETRVEFELNALVEVALRALSPGINDPFTAIACLDHLADSLRRMMLQPWGRRVIRDDDDVVRVVFPASRLGHYFGIAFHPIRGAAASNPMVLLRLADLLGQLGRLAEREEAKAVVRNHLDAIAETVESTSLPNLDRDEIDAALTAARAKVQ